MRKKLIVLCVILLCVFVFSLAACDKYDTRLTNEAEQVAPSGSAGTSSVQTPSVPAHTHTFSDVWSKDGDYHWHAATCEHSGEVKDKAEHVWDDGEITTVATRKSAGETTYTCTVCGAVKTESIDPLKDSEGLAFSLKNDDTYEVTGIGTCADTLLLIPSTHEGKAVTSIADGAFRECGELTSVVIPEGVTSVGRYAFYQCSLLRSVEIEGAVTELRSHVFYGCVDLTSIVIPATMRTIYEDALSTRSASLTIDYKGDLAGWCAISGLDRLMEPDVVLSPSLFIGGRKVTGDLVIPSGVTTVPAYAFRGCALDEVTISSDLESLVGSFAYSGVKSVVFSEGSRLTTVGSSAFAGCRLTSIVIPEGVTSVGDCAFYGCTALASVTIPLSVTNLDKTAFRDCPCVEEDHGVYYLDTWCVGAVSGSRILTIREGTRRIAAGAFSYSASYDNTLPVSISLPDSLTSVDAGTFSGCKGLRSISLPYVGGSADASILSGACLFGYIFGTTYYSGGTTVHQFYMAGSADYCIPSALAAVIVRGGAIAPNAFCDCTMLTSVWIEEGVTTIGGSAFSGCTGLTSLTIEEGVTSIEGSAFRGCGLTAVEIPASVTSIASDLFARCEALTSITVAAGNTKYCSEGNCVIETSGKRLTVGCKSSVIPADGSVTSIAFVAFYECFGLTSITIPASVTSIESYAFGGCSALTDIYYVGTEEQWNAIAKASNWAPNASYTVHFAG